MAQEDIYDDLALADGSDECEGCGDVDGCCPLCCGFTYAAGSEQCDFCQYERECARLNR